MPFSVWARGDSSSANNAALNAQGTSTTPTTQLTFQANGPGGDEKLEFNGGSPDPDTVVVINGVTYSFTLEFGGTLPQTNKLANVNGQDLRGQEILVLTISTGQRYFFLTNGTTSFATMNAFPNGAHRIDAIFACYVAGSLIETPDGARPVESLVAGDTVLADNGATASVRHVTSRHISAAEMRAFPALRPVLIPRGSLAPGEPSSDLLVSALHRILVRDADVERLFGIEAAFLAARDLPATRPAPIGDVTYWHFLCDTHQAVIANGCVSESLYPGDVALIALGRNDREQVELIASAHPQRTAYPCLSSKEAAVWRAGVQSRANRTA